MKIEKTELEGVIIINNFSAEDERGVFFKTFNKDDFLREGFEFEIRESYLSKSKKNVIRGMHFQLPPHDHVKLVYVAKGSIIDVVVDLRRKSNTYMKYISVQLSEENKKSILIPKGFAHGFKSLEDETITVYSVGTEYNSVSDSGIKYNSFGFDWKLASPIISERDMKFLSLEDFNEINRF